MTVKTRTPYQNKAIEKKRKDAIAGVFQLSPDFGCQGKVGKFIDRYILCEVIAKKVLSFHKADTGKGSTELYIPSLKSALRHFEAHCNEKKIDSVFKGGGGRKGKKSARQLRNGYIHSLNQSDKMEIEKYHSRLLKDMEYFLQLAQGLFK